MPPEATQSKNLIHPSVHTVLNTFPGTIWEFGRYVRVCMSQICPHMEAPLQLSWWAPQYYMNYTNIGWCCETIQPLRNQCKLLQTENLVHLCIFVSLQVSEQIFPSQKHCTVYIHSTVYTCIGAFLMRYEERLYSFEAIMWAKGANEHWAGVAVECSILRSENSRNPPVDPLNRASFRALEATVTPLFFFLSKTTDSEVITSFQLLQSSVMKALQRIVVVENVRFRIFVRKKISS